MARERRLLAELSCAQVRLNRLDQQQSGSTFCHRLRMYKPTSRRVMPCSCCKGFTAVGLAEGGESCFGGVEVSLERSELGSGFVDEMGGCIVDIPGVGKTAFEPFDLAA